jgi:Zn-dependent M28 family amino/carboxypeptidase
MRHYLRYLPVAATAAGLLGAAFAFAAPQASAPASVLASVLASGPATAPAIGPATGATTAVRGFHVAESDYRRHIETLASDAFEGRKPGSAGEARTLDYIEGEFRRLGLKPANGDSYRQSVPLVEITAATDAKLTISGAGASAGQSLELAYGPDVLLWTKRVQAQSAVTGSELVFVGHGVVAPEYGWNDYAGVDMKGKTALILINDPGFATEDATLFKGRSLTYYGRWTYKFEEAARQGAAGAIIIHDTTGAAYGWDVVQTSWSGPQLDAASPDGNAGRAALEGWMAGESGTKVLAMAGQDLAKLRIQASQRGFKPLPLGITAAGGVRNLIRRANSANLAAVLPGTERPGEYVVFMAHWDHLGKAMSFAGGGGDTIFNGAVDNATGVAGILAIAAALKDTKPERSVLFLAVTAEESGLLGSYYYGNNPLVPHARTAAAFNIDALHPLGRTRDVTVVGYGASSLEDELRVFATQQGRVLRPDPVPERGYFFRSDHFNLAKHGVPALYIKEGADLLEGGVERAEAIDREFNATRYHKPGDEYSPVWDVMGSIEDLELLYLMGLQQANSAAWPQWYEGSEFRNIREQSAAERVR